MRVYRIAYTIVDRYALIEATDNLFHLEESPVMDADLLTEFAGRACYQSWNRPNPATARNSDYISSAVHDKRHESITAHAMVTYYITGVSRALTHELIRHRWLSFSELSQRYVDMTYAGHVTPPGMEDDDSASDDLRHHVLDSKYLYQDLVLALENRGVSRKQAREAARAVLPSAMETKIVVSGNLRAWRDFLRQRWSVHADAEIRKLAGLILDDLRRVAPATFADIPDEPFE